MPGTIIEMEQEGLVYILGLSAEDVQTDKPRYALECKNHMLYLAVLLANANLQEGATPFSLADVVFFDDSSSNCREARKILNPVDGLVVELSGAALQGQKLAQIYCVANRPDKRDCEKYPMVPERYGADLADKTPYYGLDRLQCRSRMLEVLKGINEAIIAKRETPKLLCFDWGAVLDTCFAVQPEAAIVPATFDPEILRVLKALKENGCLIVNASNDANAAEYHQYLVASGLADGYDHHASGRCIHVYRTAILAQMLLTLTGPVGYQAHMRFLFTALYANKDRAAILSEWSEKFGSQNVGCDVVPPLYTALKFFYDLKFSTEFESFLTGQNPLEFARDLGEAWKLPSKFVDLVVRFAGIALQMPQPPAIAAQQPVDEQVVGERPSSGGGSAARAELPHEPIAASGPDNSHPLQQLGGLSAALSSMNHEPVAPPPAGAQNAPRDTARVGQSTVFARERSTEQTSTSNAGYYALAATIMATVAGFGLTAGLIGSGVVAPLFSVAAMSVIGLAFASAGILALGLLVVGLIITAAIFYSQSPSSDAGGAEPIDHDPTSLLGRGKSGAAPSDIPSVVSSPMGSPRERQDSGTLPSQQPSPNHSS